jgi:dihydrofolate reductase
MRKIIHWVHTSADGYIEGPGGEFDWAALGPELAAYSEQLSGRCDAFLFGRVVWDMMASYWPTADQGDDVDEHTRYYAPRWRETPKVVFSRTLQSAPWNTRVIGDDLVAQVTELKAATGRDMVLTGGSALAAALRAHGLVDETHVAVHPVLLGGGTPLFMPGERGALRTAGAQVCDGRVVVIDYRPA